MKRRSTRWRNTRLYLVAFVFLLLLVTGVLVMGVFMLLDALGLTPRNLFLLLTYLVTVSAVIGTVLSAILGELVVRPYRKLMAATREIAEGNFNVRVDLRGPFEAEQLAESFNRMAQELSGIETMRGDFVSNVSHEFKTPVASIRGFAKLLKKDTLSPESRSNYLDIIIRESDRLTQLASNVLLLSKLEKQEIVTERGEFLLDEQLRRAILMLAPEWTRKGIEIAADLADFPFRGSEEMLMQVWINVIGNAVKFTEEGGNVTVSLCAEGGYAVVTVADTGVGMDAEVIGHIFDKFYQGDESHSTQGNGLGLALVKRIVEMNGGRLTVESEPGRGTTVYVYLPMGENEETIAQ